MGVPSSIYRSGTWGITAPGIWIKYRHLWDLKVSLQINSALHIPQYFGTTYDLERIRFTKYDIADVLDDYDLGDLSEETLLDLINSWKGFRSMIYKYGRPCDESELLNEEYTPDCFIFPKDIYSIADATVNRFPTIGFFLRA